MRRKLYILLALSLWCGVASTQPERHVYVDFQKKTNKSKNVFATVNEAFRHAEAFANDDVWTTIHIAPGVYWIDNPDDPAVRQPAAGESIPYGMKLRLNKTRIVGMGEGPEDVVLACNRGQTQGAVGNYTMLHITGDDIQAENLTFGNYCNVDLDYKRDSRLSRKRRADAIVQAQLVICNGDRYEARNCRFISRLNLCPFAGARHALFENCYFECTDDALCGTGTYRHCRFTFFSSKPFYSTSPQGAVFEDCDIHSKVQGVQYLTKVSDPVTMRNCRWTSDDPNLTIEWTKKPNPKKRCLMENCTLNGKPLYVPMPPDVPMPVSTPLLSLMNQSVLAPGRWTLDAYKPKDTYGYDWNADTSRPAWCYGEGMDGAEGCYGLIQNVRGARMMYTGKEDETYVHQTLKVHLSPCKSAGQGFGSATGQYLDLCIKFDTRTLTGYGLRLVRTPAYDKAVEVVLVEYQEGVVSPICSPEKCVLFKKDCCITLSASGTSLFACIEQGGQRQQLTASIARPNVFGGIHIQHTGSVGASATVIQSINCTYDEPKVEALERIVMPEALKAGDTIAIVSPSSTPDSLTVVKSCDVLRQWGYVPVVGANAFRNYHGFAGTADERAADLLWALRNPAVKAILCSRGGDGAVQVLKRIPLAEFRKNPKWVMGFSDVTALHSAEVAAGVMSIHSTMCDGLASRGSQDSVNIILNRLLQGHLPNYQMPAHPLNQQGEATGMLVGGNLSVLCGLTGSEYDFLNRVDEGLILFIEDTGESMSKVDRMLHQLEIRGVLQRLKGIIVGHFSKYKSPENGFADMYHMLHEYLQHYDIPVCYDFPVGHHSGFNPPMVEGCQVRLKVGKEGTELQFIGK